MVAVEFGPKGREKAVVEDGLVWQGADKAFSEKIERRLSGPKPYAAILRIWRQDFNEKANLPQAIEELLVIKISARGACRIGSVDARRAEANTIARDLADVSAASFRCGIDQPRTIGVPSAGGS